MLTRADIEGKKGVNAVHLDYSRNRSAWMWEVEGIPRLKVYDETDRGKTQRLWMVDKEPMRDLDTALAVLNGTMKLEDGVMTHDDEAPQKPKPKLSIAFQIAEVEYELKQREKVYPRLKTNRAELEMHMNGMKAIKATLEWLRDNEPFIKQRLSY